MPDIAQERRARSILKRRLANGRGGDYLSRVKCEGGERVPQDGRPRINIRVLIEIDNRPVSAGVVKAAC